MKAVNEGCFLVAKYLLELKNLNDEYVCEIKTEHIRPNLNCKDYTAASRLLLEVCYVRNINISKEVLAKKFIQQLYEHMEQQVKAIKFMANDINLQAKINGFWQKENAISVVNPFYPNRNIVRFWEHKRANKGESYNSNHGISNNNYLMQLITKYSNTDGKQDDRLMQLSVPKVI